MDSCPWKRIGRRIFVCSCARPADYWDLRLRERRDFLGGGLGAGAIAAFACALNVRRAPLAPAVASCAEDGAVGDAVDSRAASAEDAARAALTSCACSACTRNALACAKSARPPS